MRAASVILIALFLAGCSVRLYGNQSTSGGSTATTTAAAVSGSAEFSGGRAAFSTGRVPPPGARGGYVSLGGNAAAVLLVGIVIADFLNTLRDDSAPKPLPPGTRIADTCSCFKQDAQQ